MRLLVSVSVLAGPVSALQTTRALVERALSEPTQITLKNIKLGDALRVIADQTGVQVVMEPKVMSLVPQGAETLITKVDIANISLREGLTRLFAPLGMTFAVVGDHVEVVPTDALRALGRAPTWEELETLVWLTGLRPGENAEALSALLGRVQFQVPTVDTRRSLSDAIRAAGAGPGDEVLSIACRALGLGWTLSERQIVVSPLELQIRQRLKNPISLRMRNRTLFEVMSAIGDAVRVRVQAEPDALAFLPPQVQKNFSLDVRNRPAEQALDEIAAYTGLGYLIGPEGVVFYRALEMPSTGESKDLAAASNSDPYIAKMTVPLKDGRTLEWLIRKSELPEDLQHLREQDIQELIETLRHRAAQGPR